MKFCQFVASIYPHMLTNIGRFILLFNKMALIFLGVLIVFTVSSFQFQQVLTSSLMMSSPNSPNLNPLDYQVWGNTGVLTKAATEAETSSGVLTCTLVNLVCVTEESH